jgi:hypothetical protein
MESKRKWMPLILTTATLNQDLFFFFFLWRRRRRRAGVVGHMYISNVSVMKSHVHIYV